MTMPTVLITGATRGIGRALVSELADDHHLILGGRDRADLRELAAQLPSARPFPADLTDPPAVAEQVAALDLAQGLDGLVHSAGVLVRGRIEELSAADWTRSFTANVTAIADLTRLLLPALRQARGTVVAFTSGSGFTSGTGGSAYAAPSYLLTAFTAAMND